jgi:hypothetical protein
VRRAGLKGHHPALAGGLPAGHRFPAGGDQGVDVAYG